MYGFYQQYPYSVYPTAYPQEPMNRNWNMYPNPYNSSAPFYSPDVAVDSSFNYPQPPMTRDPSLVLRDYGPHPFAVNIEDAATQNTAYRTALWTGRHLQVTLMSINPGEDIGLEVHPVTDQFLRIEEGQGLVQMGDRENHLTYQKAVSDNFAIMVPAGTWHNVINTGHGPLKLYSIYAPPHHPHGTVQQTKAIAQAEEGPHHR